jgi:hypothetical protein
MLIKIDTRPSAYIFDVDGTLANVDPYLHYVRGSDRDYDAFHEASIDALPNVKVVEMLNNAVSDCHTILIVTSRKEKYRGLTSMWMAINNIRSHALFMRADEDNRPDYEVKKDILDKINKHWTVYHAVDDNPNVIRLWEENGISTTKIGTWDGNKS